MKKIDNVSYHKHNKNSINKIYFENNSLILIYDKFSFKIKTKIKIKILNNYYC